MYSELVGFKSWVGGCCSDLIKKRKELNLSRLFSRNKVPNLINGCLECTFLIYTVLIPKTYF